MMTAPTTGGAGALVSLETTAGRPDIRGFPFDGTTNENVEFEIALPKKWALGTVTARFYWSTVGLDTDSVIWGIQMVAVSDGSTIDVAYGSAIEVTDNIQGVTEELQISAATAAITAAGTPADADMLYIRIYRDAATDTAAEDAVLAGVKLFLTMDAATDD